MFKPSPRSSLILVIESSPRWQEFLTKALRIHDMRTVVAETVERGLQEAYRHRPIGIISELCLPGKMTGLDLCRTLRQANLAIPVIIVTWDVHQHWKERVMQEGASGYLQKDGSLLRTLPPALRELGWLRGSNPRMRGAAVRDRSILSPTERQSVA